MNKDLDEILDVYVPPSDAELFAYGLLGDEHAARPVRMSRRDYEALRVIHGTIISIFIGIGLITAYGEVKSGIEKEGSFKNWYNSIKPNFDKIPNWNF